MFQIASLKCSSCNAEIVELLVTGANNLIVLGLRRWFGVVDSSCWFVDVHCKWFQFSSEEPVLTEISTVTGANNLILLGLRRWFGVVDSSCWCVDVHCRWFQFSSEEPMLTECLFIYL